MSYDLHFFKLQPGLTAAQQYEALEDVEEGGPPTAESRAIADALLAAGLGLEEFPKDLDEIARHMKLSRDQAEALYGSIELNVPEDSLTPFQIDISPSEVTITIPYWDMPQPRVQALGSALDKIFLVMEKHGMVGYDPQLECEADPSHFAQMVGTINSVRDRVVADTAKKKPWWKFW